MLPLQLSIAWTPPSSLHQATWYQHISSPGLIFMKDIYDPLHSFTHLHGPLIIAFLSLHYWLDPLMPSPLLALHHLNNPLHPEPLASLNTCTWYFIAKPCLDLLHLSIWDCHFPYSVRSILLLIITLIKSSTLTSWALHRHIAQAISPQ